MTAAHTETTNPARTPGAQDVHDPIHRATYSFEREGENLWVHTTLGADGHLPEHFHPSLEERWEALDGTARVKLDGVWRELRPSDGPVVVGRGVKHELKNEGGADVRMRALVLPAGGLEEFLCESAQAARDGLFNARNLPTSWRGAVWVAGFALRFRDETVMCSPPPALQRVLLPLIARFG